MKKTLMSVVIASMIGMTGCTRIPTGEVGLRVDINNQVQTTELLPGSWNQTLVGHVMKFPVREISVEVNDKHPLTSDNSAMGDFDVTVVYSINPSAVSDIYSTKSKAFHSTDAQNEIYLMHRYIETLIVNAENIAVREYKSLEIADNRKRIEDSIKAHIEKELTVEKLDKALIISAVQIRSAVPNQAILDSATLFVKSQNELKIKENEVKLAKLEAERMSALAANSSQSIAYMQAQANITLAEAVKAGKVQTILIPHGMTMLGSLK